MERFEVSSERAGSIADRAIPQRPVTGVLSPAVAPAASTASSSWDGAAVVVPASASYGGLLGIGAVAGSAAGVGVGALIGVTGPVLTFAALIGLDIGVLLGAGAGALLARRHRRAARRALSDAG
ncbi:hypothetical protein [Nitriliruptor alkaliphilus]|uniref:hypothetical protein n=1 Tax=Nitriliruptor alkaliphilus TaxID=427918 RepID=UPI001B806D5A|nr:hypothetical protein [Nitriliruptor alkaliphilus]